MSGERAAGRPVTLLTEQLGLRRRQVLRADYPVVSKLLQLGQLVGKRSLRARRGGMAAGDGLVDCGPEFLELRGLLLGHQDGVLVVHGAGSLAAKLGSAFGSTRNGELDEAVHQGTWWFPLHCRDLGNVDALLAFAHTATGKEAFAGDRDVLAVELHLPVVSLCLDHPFIVSPGGPARLLFTRAGVAATAQDADFADRPEAESTTAQHEQEARMSAHFEVYEDKAHQWRFRLKAGNGEIVAVGEAYETKANAERGCEAVKRAAAEADVIEAKAA